MNIALVILGHIRVWSYDYSWSERWPMLGISILEITSMLQGGPLRSLLVGWFQVYKWPKINAVISPDVQLVFGPTLQHIMLNEIDLFEDFWAFHFGMRITYFAIVVFCGWYHFKLKPEIPTRWVPKTQNPRHKWGEMGSDKTPGIPIYKAIYWKYNSIYKWKGPTF